MRPGFVKSIDRAGLADWLAVSQEMGCIIIISCAFNDRLGFKHLELS